MRKLFLLIPALVLSLLANATRQTISPSSDESDSNIRSALSGSADTIILNAGNYKEADQIHFRRNAVIMAAEGAEVIITLKYYCDLVYANTKVKIIGIKFDGSVSGQQAIRVYDDNAGKELRLENCEFYNFAKDVITCDDGTRTIDSCIINNCYFHDNDYSAIYFNKSSVEGQQTIYGLKVTNSTFANNDPSKEYRALIDVQSYNREATDDIEVIVDHCTFYNNPVMNYDYSAVRTRIVNRTTVSNCIFMHPTAQEWYATNAWAGTVTNCLAYNLNKGYMSGPTRTNTNTGNPLFTDAANGDYTFAGDWTTMELSPARGAATDGSNLGDPRWYSNETLPSTSFASAYDLIGTKALLTGDIELNASDHIKYKGTSTPGTAKWKLHVGKMCVINAVVDIESGSTSGRQLTLTVKDADGNNVGSVAQASATYNDADINLGSLTIPEEGDYTFILTNSTANSGAILEKITLSYVGGAVQAMPGTTDINDAWFSSNGTRADGKISYTSIGSGCWAKWNIAVASAGTYNVIVNIQNEYGHNYTVEFLKEGSGTPISVSEGATTYGHDATLYPVEVGAIALEAGNYVMTVSNSIGDAALLSTTLSYAGGGVIEFGKDAAASLLANADAIVSSDWSIEGGKITHAESKALTGWAKWNVDCADYGNYNVTVNISSDNGHLVRVEIFEDEAEPAIYTLDETSATQYHTGDQAIDLGNIVLDAREYVVKVSNTGEYSHVQIASIAITYLNGAQATLPATCTFADLMLSEKAHITEGNLWFNTIGDSNPVGQWAKWNVKVASAGTFLFTMNVSSTNGQSYKISILDGETEIDAFESGSVGSGDQEVKHYFNLAAGNYTVKLENTTSWSQGHIVSLVVSQPSLLTIDEAATSNTVIHNNYRNGNHDIQTIRTITPYMYNTICLPFDVNGSQLQAIFGTDVELRQMASATLSDDVLTLNFDAAASIYRGTPYLIKTTKAVVNPVFTGVEIKEETGQATSGDNANFVGSFIKGTVPAGEDYLFLGANDLLYFSEAATTIKGMRAYFQIHDVPSGAPIRQARIVEQGNVVTALEFVNGEWQEIKSDNGTIKTIENGQLILIRDGKRYNVMGIRF